MKKFKKTKSPIFRPLFAFCVALVLPLIVSCAGGAAAKNSNSTASGGGIAANRNQAAGNVSGEVQVRTLSDVQGKEWILSELRSGGTTVRIDRSKIEAASTRGSFTISFQEGMVSGMGWPNSYRGPYTTGSGDALSIGNAASTMMAAFIELDELKENEYFTYLSNVTRWAVQDGRLELYSSNAGRETTLVYVLNSGL